MRATTRPGASPTGCGVQPAMRSQVGGLARARRRRRRRERRRRARRPGAPPVARGGQVEQREVANAVLGGDLRRRPAVGQAQLAGVGLQAVPAARRIGLEARRRPRRAAPPSGRRRRRGRAGRRSRRPGPAAARTRRRRASPPPPAVAEEAASGLAPEQAAVDHLALHQRRHVALVAEVGVEHRLGHREVGVVADQVHQLARPHAKAAAAQARVEHRRLGERARAAAPASRRSTGGRCG